jgi:hypothetical protein
MKPKFTSLLALLLALSFVAVLGTQAFATDCDKAKTAQEQADQKVEVKAKVEEEQGKSTVEVKALEPSADSIEEAAKSKNPE